MRPLSDRIASADTLLAPYAVSTGGGLGREYDESDDATRFPFQRDRDRIIHTQAFRRLKHKTQVFVSGHGDHYRTRITHTLEVAQISRDVARTLGLNEDLAESIALAHDLGHTPFGHAGEEAMNRCMASLGKTFEHNQQSLRIVRVLEDRSNKYPGLNLQTEILEGLLKHRTAHDHPDIDTAFRSPSLEAQVVNLADEIAYTAHDTDDGLRAGQLNEERVRDTALGTISARASLERGTEIRGSIVDILVSDLYQETERRLREHSIYTLEDVYRAETPLVAFSSQMETMLAEHRAFLWDHFYKSSAVVGQAERGAKIITSLFSAYVLRPPAKVKALQQKTNDAVEDAVKDYIAGMTDTYAIAEFEKLPTA